MLLDELFEQERHIRVAMANRSGVLGLLLHQTIDHDPLHPLKMSTWRNFCNELLAFACRCWYMLLVWMIRIGSIISWPLWCFFSKKISCHTTWRFFFVLLSQNCQKLDNTDVMQVISYHISITFYGATPPVLHSTSHTMFNSTNTIKIGNKIRMVITTEVM